MKKHVLLNDKLLEEIIECYNNETNDEFLKKKNISEVKSLFNNHGSDMELILIEEKYNQINKIFNEFAKNKLLEINESDEKYFYERLTNKLLRNLMSTSDKIESSNKIYNYFKLICFISSLIKKSKISSNHYISIIDTVLDYNEIDCTGNLIKVIEKDLLINSNISGNTGTINFDQSKIKMCFNEHLNKIKTNNIDHLCDVKSILGFYQDFKPISSNPFKEISTSLFYNNELSQNQGNIHNITSKNEKDNNANKSKSIENVKKSNFAEANNSCNNSIFESIENKLIEKICNVYKFLYNISNPSLEIDTTNILDNVEKVVNFFNKYSETKNNESKVSKINPYSKLYLIKLEDLIKTLKSSNTSNLKNIYKNNNIDNSEFMINNLINKREFIDYGIIKLDEIKCKQISSINKKIYDFILSMNTKFTLSNKTIQIDNNEINNNVNSSSIFNENDYNYKIDEINTMIKDEYFQIITSIQILIGLNELKKKSKNEKNPKSTDNSKISKIERNIFSFIKSKSLEIHDFLIKNIYNDNYYSLLPKCSNLNANNNLNLNESSLEENFKKKLCELDSYQNKSNNDVEIQEFINQMLENKNKNAINEKPFNSFVYDEIYNKTNEKYQETGFLKCKKNELYFDDYCKRKSKKQEFVTTEEFWNWNFIRKINQIDYHLIDNLKPIDKEEKEAENENFTIIDKIFNCYKPKDSNKITESNNAKAINLNNKIILNNTHDEIGKQTKNKINIEIDKLNKNKDKEFKVIENKNNDNKDKINIEKKSEPQIINHMNNDHIHNSKHNNELLNSNKEVAVEKEVNDVVEVKEITESQETKINEIEKNNDFATPKIDILKSTINGNKSNNILNEENNNEAIRKSQDSDKNNKTLKSSMLKNSLVPNLKSNINDKQNSKEVDQNKEKNINSIDKEDGEIDKNCLTNISPNYIPDNMDSNINLNIDLETKHVNKSIDEVKNIENNTGKAKKIITNNSDINKDIINISDDEIKENISLNLINNSNSAKHLNINDISNVNECCFSSEIKISNENENIISKTAILDYKNQEIFDLKNDQIIVDLDFNKNNNSPDKFINRLIDEKINSNLVENYNEKNDQTFNDFKENNFTLIIDDLQTNCHNIQKDNLNSPVSKTNNIEGKVNIISNSSFNENSKADEINLQSALNSISNLNDNFLNIQKEVLEVINLNDTEEEIDILENQNDIEMLNKKRNIDQTLYVNNNQVKIDEKNSNFMGIKGIEKNNNFRENSDNILSLNENSKGKSKNASDNTKSNNNFNEIKNNNKGNQISNNNNSNNINLNKNSNNNKNFNNSYENKNKDDYYYKEKEKNRDKYDDNLRNKEKDYSKKNDKDTINNYDYDNHNRKNDKYDKEYDKNDNYNNYHFNNNNKDYKNNKDSRDIRDNRDYRESKKDYKDNKDNRNYRDYKDYKDFKDKDYKDYKDYNDNKDFKDSKNNNKDKNYYKDR